MTLMRTPIDKVKGPNVFERAKEEIEAIVEAITSKKESHHDPTTKKEGNFFFPRCDFEVALNKFSGISFGHAMLATLR